MKYKCEIVSPWIGSGFFGDAFRSQLQEEYALLGREELSVRPAYDYISNPNIGTMVCIVTADVLATLEADDNYLILSCEEVQDAVDQA